MALLRVCGIEVEITEDRNNNSIFIGNATGTEIPGQHCLFCELEWLDEATRDRLNKLVEQMENTMKELFTVDTMKPLAIAHNRNIIRHSDEEVVDLSRVVDNKGVATALGFPQLCDSGI